jgi:hypothetical protein
MFAGTLKISGETYMKRDFILQMLIIMLVVFVAPATAHQPFFEDKDFTADNPKYINDPTISTAVYAALETPNDVDYYTFYGSNGESILLSITIPQIAGQENFTPIMALMGPEVPSIDLPKQVIKPQNSGALILPPPANATTFFEPFSRTSYWTRQEQNVSLLANSSYVVAVWDDKGQIGRYVFVIGYKEVLGGDPAFPLKMKSYWKPLTPLSQELTSTPSAKEAASSGKKAQPGFETIFALTGFIGVAYLNLRRNP